jgi:hypothetical protein
MEIRRMTRLKLPRLPDRTPVKMTIQILPELADALQKYAAAYEQAYGSSEAVADLIPYMLSAFLESDREFARSVKS